MRAPITVRDSGLGPGSTMSSADTRLTIHDAHCHFFSPRFFEALAREKPSLAQRDPAGAVSRALGWEPPGQPAELADRWAAELDQHGVSRAALIASILDDEESVAVAVARHPQRFVGLFMLDPTREGAEDRAKRAFTKLGLRCVCLFPAMHRYRLDDECVLKIFELTASHPGTAVFVHCGVLSVGVRKKLGLPSRFDMRLGDPLALHLTASTYPELPIVIPHFGAGLFREALMVADLCPNIYLDTSSSNGWIRYQPGLTLADAFRQALEVVGPGRLLFGTDSSFFPRGWHRAVWEGQKTILEQSGIDSATMDRIFYRNFESVFGSCAL